MSSIRIEWRLTTYRRFRGLAVFVKRSGVVLILTLVSALGAISGGRLAGRDGGDSLAAVFTVGVLGIAVCTARHVLRTELAWLGMQSWNDVYKCKH